MPTTEGETPLDWAVYKGDRAKIQALEQRGATRGNGPRREEIAPPAKGGITDSRLSVNKSVGQLLDAAQSAFPLERDEFAFPATGGRASDSRRALRQA